MPDKRNLIEALQDLRTLAVQVSQGAIQKKDLGAARRDLSRRLVVAQNIDTAITLANTTSPTSIASLRAFEARGGLAAGMNDIRNGLELGRAFMNIVDQDYSVGSIDAAIRIAARS